MNRSKKLRKIATMAAERVPIPPNPMTGRVEPRSRAVVAGLLYRAIRKVWQRLTAAERTQTPSLILETVLVQEFAGARIIRTAQTIADRVLERLRPPKPSSGRHGSKPKKPRKTTYTGIPGTSSFQRLRPKRRSRAHPKSAGLQP